MTDAKRKKWDSFNWPALKQEWIQRNLAEGISLNRFQIEKGVTDPGKFYKRVKDEKWAEKRDEIRKKSLAKAEERIVDKVVDKYLVQKKIYHTTEKLVLGYLKRHLDKDGNMLFSPDMNELSAATLSANRALGGRRLIEGQPTQITESHTLSLGIMKIIADNEAGNAIETKSTTEEAH